MNGITNKELLTMSNNSIRKMKKGQLVDAILSLKSMYNDVLSSNNPDATSIELAELTLEIEALKASKSALMQQIIGLKDELRITYKKGIRKAEAIHNLKYELDLYKKRGFWDRVFNTI
jgi:hypothetical protein